MVRSCAYPSKCRKCRSDCRTKHATALHDYYVKPDDETLGAAEAASSAPTSGFGAANDYDVIVNRKIDSVDKRVVLLRTCAVRVINPDTKKSTLAYAQLDTASQATLISERLCNELGLKRKVNASTAIRTRGDCTTKCNGHSDFDLTSLADGNTLGIKGALIVSNFEVDENTLPHRIDTFKHSHFRGVQISVISYRKSVDLLIGQSDKFPLNVLEEREGFNSNEPNYVLTRLGPMASGGRMDICLNRINSRPAIVNMCKCDARECENLRLEDAGLKENLRKIELKDEELLPSREDEMARSLVEPNIKVVNGRFEIPVPLKAELTETLPDNYELALKHTLSLRTSALKNPVLKQTFIDTFSELIKEGWIKSVDNVHSVSPKWYLPYFVTKQGKPRVVFDGAATFGGVSLNQAVLAGTNLLNSLVEVLTRFRLGKFACMADLSKCFFQVAVPEAQRTRFELFGLAMVIWRLAHHRCFVFRDKFGE